MLVSVLLAPAMASLAHSTSLQSVPAPGCPSSRSGILRGTVRDSTDALVPGATLILDGKETVRSGSDGLFSFSCVAKGPHSISVSFEGFAPTDLKVQGPQNALLRIVLQPASVQTNVEVNAGEGTIPSGTQGAASTKLSGKQLQSLADDPDDLLRELQQLGAIGGGNPANTTIAVDGFLSNSTLPPKSSIAYIQVNPDSYSAEYLSPPYDGGRVVIYTKPGQSTFHGALFTTNGSPWENARDPFSPNKAAIGKQRYGFELTGPVKQQGSDFSLDLEHRAINNYAVVNAITLDSGGNQLNTIANVATPQSLWVGQARLDWQLGARNTFISTYSANVNSLQNVGVGGTMLAETGYNSGQYAHTLRLTDVTVVSPHVMHEARLALQWAGQTNVPLSTAPQVQVAGSFTSGGATLGNQRLRELNTEADDDAIITTKEHTIKFGTELMIFDEHQQLTTNFNGNWTTLR